MSKPRLPASEWCGTLRKLGTFFCLGGTLVELSTSQDHGTDNRTWSPLSCWPLSHCAHREGHRFCWGPPRLQPCMLLGSRWSVWTSPMAHCLHRLPWGLSGKESTCQRRRCGLDPWVRKIPWRRKWQPTPVFLPGKTPMERGAWWATVPGVAQVLDMT